MSNQQASVAAELRAELDAWLKSTNAKLPTQDPRYQPSMTIAKQEKAAQETKPRLEKQHARFLEDGFQPDPTWWGSQPKK